MNAENLLCSICKEGTAAVFCLCTSEEIFLCADCIGSHTVKTQGQTHVTRPINQLHYYKIPGYAERLQVRTLLCPQVRTQVIQCVQVTDKAIQDLTDCVEKTVWEAVQYSKRIVRQLNDVKEELSRETELALAEVERTLVEDRPQLASMYGPVFRELTENLRPFQLFSYIFTTSAPQAIFQLQSKRYPPQDIYIPDMAEEDANVGHSLAVSVLNTEKSKYEGPLKEGKQHGFGVEVWALGDRYEGHYDSGKKHGKGTFQGANGDVYTGDFFDDAFHGRGEYKYADGRRYDGEWKHGQSHGKGTFTLPDGRLYKGEYFEDKKQGFGIYEWPDGRKYEGLWFNGKQHGEGVLFMPNDLPKAGEWREGKRIRWLDDTDVHHS